MPGHSAPLYPTRAQILTLGSLQRIAHYEISTRTNMPKLLGQPHITPPVSI